MPRKVFVSGEILTASDVNTQLMDQSVMVFDDATDRATAIPTPVEGMVTYLKDTDRLEQFDGTNFVVAAPPQTGVLQVVSTTKTDVFTTSSATFTAITGLTASITPTATSSKVLAIVGVSGATTQATGGSIGGFRLMRDSTPLGVGTNVSNRSAVTGSLSTRNIGSLSVQMSATQSVLDTPATASAITYSVEAQVSAGTLFVNRQEDDADISSNQRTVSTLTLMEVAG